MVMITMEVGRNEMETRDGIEGNSHFQVEAENGLGPPRALAGEIHDD
jgi:hypothetical protein